MKSTSLICFFLTFLLSFQIHCVGAEINTRELAKNGDIDGLTRLLRHPDGVVRSSAAIELSNAIRYVDSEDRLIPFVRQYLDSSLRDPYQTVREHAGRSFQHSIRNISKPHILQGLVPILVDSLHPKEVEVKRRRYAAVMLAELMPRIENTNTMRVALSKILDSTLNDSDEQTREYSGRAVQVSLRKVKNQEALSEAAKTLTNALKSKESKRRQFAAIQLSGLVAKLEDQRVCRHIAPAIEDIAKNDPDATIREYADRADKHLRKKLELKKLRATN